MKWNSVMAHISVPSNVIEDLWMDINTRHISYLCEDKSLEKLKCQNRLENSIKQFIYIVPHQDKFTFPKTAKVLQQSVFSEKFNALKAATAWLSLSTYANNLYSQPWRKEYHEIKLYSGFYKHQIEKCLSGAEAIFELMGYDHVSGDKMVLKGPVNDKQLVVTSLDALIAMCECQVLFTIFKETSKHIPTITWLDVLRVRELYAGPPDEMIKILFSLFLYPRDCSDCHFNYSRYQLAPACRKCALAQSSPCVPLNGYHVAAYSPSVPSVRHHYSAPITADHLPFANGHYRLPVPTAKLIDYEDTLDGYPTPTLSASRRHVPASVERWNWTNDCVPPPSSSHRHHHSADCRYTPSSSSESVSYEENNVRTRAIRPSVERSSAGLGTSGGTVAVVAGSNDSRNCWRQRDQSSGSESSHRTWSAPGEETQPLKSMAAAAVCAAPASVAPEPVAESASAGGTISTSTWECGKCTFHNPLGRNVCEMCGKSRNASEEASLVSGGKQCKFCTLVNQREATTCEACLNSLENSPTYV